MRGDNIQGWLHPPGGDTRVKSIKSDEQKRSSVFQEKINSGDTAELTEMTKKCRQLFQEKNRGVTPSVATPGVTHPSDANALN